ncbi:ead/Ea22-like family protein [Escherichia coli]|nr:ead/Ea22-like family protein [Escherichia coli]EEZ6573802.1 ead/Ea22-like family protein [Escherichia coli]EFM0572915.1 ead/Ea22-like family protein [Escherichia coli]EFM0582468.1 ead/Ea22-like family protein [Escherichia coli]EFM0588355.1 ead/Ea22-like family protein [Escherichia coli]
MARMTIDYQALREKAEKATCGVWSLEYGEEGFDAGDALIHREVVGYLPICRIEGAHPESGFDEDFQMEQQANAEFIAAANPATVLELLDELEAAKKRIAELEAEPVSQAYNLPELIEGMEVSIDVSTCDADLGNRYFGTVTEASELDTAKNGYILLVQDAEPNFDINGNSPVTPDGWVMVPKELTQEMMRAVQIRSELGGYATSNLSGAYNMFSEFWNVAVSAAPKVDDL